VGAAGHLDDPTVDAYLVVFDGRPAGRRQVCGRFADESHSYRDRPTGCRGIDQIIGDVAATGSGHGPAMPTARDNGTER